MSAPEKIWAVTHSTEYAPPDYKGQEVGQWKKRKFTDATEYTRTDLSQAAVAAALEAAAKEHDAEIARLEAQIVENKNYLRLAGKSERSSANDFCDAAIGHHRVSAARLRALPTTFTDAELIAAAAELILQHVLGGPKEDKEDPLIAGAVIPWLQDLAALAQIGAKP